MLAFAEGRATTTDLRGARGAAQARVSRLRGRPAARRSVRDARTGLPGPRFSARGQATAAADGRRAEGPRLLPRHRARAGPRRDRSDDGGSRSSARSSSPSTPTRLDHGVSRRRAACSSSAAACSPTRPSSRASWAFPPSCRCQASPAGCEDGDWVEMDGSTGIVRRIPPPEAERCVAKRPRAPISARSATRRSGRTPTSCSRVSTSSRATSASRSPRPATTPWRCSRKIPSRVIALDLSPAQLACLELRVAAYRTLTHPELLELSARGRRRAALELFDRCRPALARPRASSGTASGPQSSTASAASASSSGTSRCSAIAFCRSSTAGRTVARPSASRGRPKSGGASMTERWDTWRWRLLFRCSSRGP